MMPSAKIANANSPATGRSASAACDEVWMLVTPCRFSVTAFLGDGALRYGREKVAELYYSADLGAGFALTADVQRVANPGYNKDRGPVSFYAVRLHWEV